MAKPLISLAALCALTACQTAQPQPLPAAAPAAQAAEPQGAPSPGEIIAAAPAGEWKAIPATDVLVMELAPDGSNKARRIVIQLMPAPFSQGWIDNIRTLARAHWYDGVAVVRVQDNYVVQWGDPDGEDAAKAKRLPAGMRTIDERDYVVHADVGLIDDPVINGYRISPSVVARDAKTGNQALASGDRQARNGDAYADATGFYDGWPIAGSLSKATSAIPDPRFPDHLQSMWPVHCYGMVGVGRGYSPDTGSGAELYTVIGHAPRHLDRNIALVGRVIEGIENLSSLPRGTGHLGFYEDPAQRVAILSVRLASELPAAEQPLFEYLDTDSDSFARYADARANRRDPFFIVPAGGADICNIPVPVRRAYTG